MGVGLGVAGGRAAAWCAQVLTLSPPLRFPPSVWGFAPTPPGAAPAAALLAAAGAAADGGALQRALVARGAAAAAMQRRAAAGRIALNADPAGDPKVRPAPAPWSGRPAAPGEAGRTQGRTLAAAVWPLVRAPSPRPPSRFPCPRPQAPQLLRSLQEAEGLCCFAEVPVGPAEAPLGVLLLGARAAGAFDGDRWAAGGRSAAAGAAACQGPRARPPRMPPAAPRRPSPPRPSPPPPARSSPMRLQAAASGMLHHMRHHRVGHVCDLLAAVDEAAADPIDAIDALLQVRAERRARAAPAAAALGGGGGSHMLRSGAPPLPWPPNPVAPRQPRPRPNPQGVARHMGRITNARMGARLALLPPPPAPGCPPSGDALIFERTPAGPAGAGAASTPSSSGSSSAASAGRPSLSPQGSLESAPPVLSGLSAAASDAGGARAASDPRVLATRLPLQGSLLRAAVGASMARFIKDCGLYLKVGRPPQQPGRPARRGLRRCGAAARSGLHEAPPPHLPAAHSRQTPDLPHLSHLCPCPPTPTPSPADRAHPRLRHLLRRLARPRRLPHRRAPRVPRRRVRRAVLYEWSALRLRGPPRRAARPCGRGHGRRARPRRGARGAAFRDGPQGGPWRAARGRRAASGRPVPPRPLHAAGIGCAASLLTRRPAASATTPPRRAPPRRSPPAAASPT
jgi:hypothetical protein